jgi:hypothetical protein
VSIRFDDSLPILCKVIEDELDADVLGGGATLRDAAGRLAFFAGSPLDGETNDRVSAVLREQLGEYARTDRVLAGADDFGASRVLEDPNALCLSVGEHRIRLVDRRMVGADWLRTPAEASGPPPRLVFASLKGGVGRSTALAVAAADLASRGLRVLAVDLDLEAPGLGPMLLEDDTLPAFGTLDALVENGISGLDERFLADLIGPSGLAGGLGRIDVMPAFGRQSLVNAGEILAKLSRAYTEDVRAEGGVATFRDQVAELLQRFSDPDRYDAILIDARAGLHESTAAAVLGLGAEVLLFGLDEPQTFQGFRALLAHLARFVDPDAAAAPEWLARLTVVQGKATSAESRRAFAERCRDLVEEMGLGPRPPRPHAGALVPAEPFNDPEWDETLPDDAVLQSEDWGLGEPVAIADDGNYRGFDPLRRGDLLAEGLYRATFGTFLGHIHSAVPSDREAGHED